MVNAVVSEPKKTILTNKSYDFAKDFVLVYAPAAVTLYAGMAVLWGWLYTDKVVASAGLIITFLGIIVKVSSARFNNLPVDYDGILTVNETDPEKDVMHLNIDRTLSELGDKKQVVLQINNPLKNGPSQ